MAHITFVKKILADGSPCAKCADVEARLKRAGSLSRIDQVLVADERDPQSPGMLLAAELSVQRAPFFVVRDSPADTGTNVRVYTVYFRFAKEVLGAPETGTAEAQELLRDNPELDLL